MQSEVSGGLLSHGMVFVVLEVVFCLLLAVMVVFLVNLSFGVLLLWIGLVSQIGKQGMVK